MCKREKIFTNLRIAVILVLVNATVYFFFHEFIFSEEVLELMLSEQVESTKIEPLFEEIGQMSILGMVTILIILVIQWIFIAFLLQFSLLIQYIEIQFNYIFRVVMIASIPLALGQILKMLWIYTKLVKWWQVDPRHLRNDP